MKVICSSLEKERKWVTSFSLSIWTWVCFLKGEAGWASASHRPGLSSSEGFPGLVWRKRGLPSPEKLLFAALYPHHPAHLAARMRRRRPSSGSWARGFRSLPGGSWPDSRAPWTCMAPLSRGLARQPQRVASHAGRPGVRGSLRGDPEGPGRPAVPGRGVRTGVEGGLVEASGALHGRGAPRSGLPAQTFHGELL